MKQLLLFLCALVLVAACGTETTGGRLEIDQIRERLERNSCRIQRDNLVFMLQDMEFKADTTYTAMPDPFPADSLLVCPVTAESYLLVVSGGERLVECPSGHGSTSL